MQLHSVTYGATNSVASRLPCEIFNIRGNFAGAVDSYLQIHDASQLPANGAVPVFSIPLAAAAYYSWDWPRGLHLANGCVAVVSTSSDDLTISTEEADFFIDGTATLVLSSPSVVGNLSTEQSSLDVITAPAVLYQLKVRLGDNAAGGDVWAHLFKLQVADVFDGDVPFIRHKFPDGTASINRTFSFGRSGLLVPDFCVIASSTGPTLTALSAGDELIIEAVYKAV